jgi:hypothetical protein
VDGGECGLQGGVLIGSCIWVIVVVVVVVAGREWRVEPGGITFGCIYAEGKRFLVQNVWGESVVRGLKDCVRVIENRG